MNKLLSLVSYLALAALAFSCIAYLIGSIDRDLMKQVMLTATIAWFGTVPWWMGKKSAD